MVTFYNYTMSPDVDSVPPKKIEKKVQQKMLTVFAFLVFYTVYQAVVPSSTIIDTQ